MSSTLGSAFQPFLEDPYPFYASLRREEPITFSPEFNAWFVTRYKDIQNSMLQPDIFSSRNAIFSAPDMFTPRVFAEIAKGHIPDVVVVNIDKPDHTRLKAALTRAFILVRIKGIESFAREVANRLVDAFIHQRQAEIVSQFAYPLIFEVVLTLLGVPRQDLSLTKTWVDDWIAGAPHKRQMLSVPNGIGTDGTFHACLAYPKPRKRRATIACEDGHVGRSHQSLGWSMQDVYGECYTV